MRDIFVVTGMLRRVGLTYFLRERVEFRVPIDSSWYGWEDKRLRTNVCTVMN